MAQLAFGRWGLRAVYAANQLMQAWAAQCSAEMAACCSSIQPACYSMHLPPCTHASCAGCR